MDNPTPPVPVPEPAEQPVEKPDKKLGKLPLRQRLHLWPRSWSRKRKRLATAGLVLALVLLAGGGYYWYRQHHKPAPVAVVKVKKQAEPAAPTTVASPLTGVQVSPDLAKRPVTAVMIENSMDARPQSGLVDAGVVFEAVAEGGVTRFMALYQEAQPTYIGPIRSARPYFLDWMLPFDAAYSHVGGSPEALGQIKTLGIKNLDQFFNAGYYTRITTRYAPHNVYTSMAKFDQLEKAKGYTTSKFTGFARKPEAKAATPTATSIDINLSGYLYNVHYAYNPTNNNYLRSEGGKPHIDERSKQQITPKVVVTLVMPHHLESDGYHNSYDTVGEGAMYVFQDGTITKGNWKKTSRTAQFSFTDQNGQTLKLNPGQTWITMVESAGAVTYK